jgi:glyoxylate reductase
VVADLLLGRDLHGATLGLIGLGEIGRAVARRARGFGMRVLGWSRTPRRVEGVEPRELPALLAESDFVSVHLALAPETRGLLGARALASLRPGAILVNTARGGIVDEAALAAALASGRLAAAALDVYASEPLPPTSPLLTAPNLVLTPQSGARACAPARGWPTSPSTTSSPACAASACPTARTRRSTARSALHNGRGTHAATRRGRRGGARGRRAGDRR